MGRYYASGVCSIAEIPLVAHNRTVWVITTTSVESDGLTGVNNAGRLGERRDRRTVKHGFSGIACRSCASIISDCQVYEIVAVVNVCMVDCYACGVEAVAKAPKIADNRAVRIIAARSIEVNRLACVHGLS